MSPPRQLDLPFLAPPAAPLPPEPAAVEIAGDDRQPTAARLTRLAQELADGLHLPALAAAVTVVWNRRLRTTAGRAHYSALRIELNPRLTKADDPAEIDRTFRHELAHLVAHARHAGGRRIEAHGPEWRKACADLGIPDEARCHTLELAPRRKIRKRFAYQCPECHSVILRVKKFARYSACYACCKRFNGGRYHTRYQLVAIPLPPGQPL